MSASVTDLLTALTAAQIRATMVNALKVLGVPADQWKKGGVFSTILTVVSMLLAMFSALQAMAFAAGFLETATGPWLRVLAIYVYGIDPSALQPTFASGSLTLTNAGTNSFTYGAGGAIFEDSTTGAQYSNGSSFTLGPSSTITITVNALLAGSASSAPPGGIDTVVTAMLGVTCSNASAVVGLDAPDDPTVRSLCFNKLGAMSVRGPRTAYEYAIQTATNAVTGAPVNINRWTVTPSSHTGTVAIVLASPSGVPDPNDVLGVETNVEAIARPDAVTVTFASATTVPYSQAITVYAKALPGLVPADLQTAIENQLALAFSNYPIGGYLKPSTGATGVWASGIDAAIGEVSAAIFDIDGTVDLPLTAGEVAVDATSVSVVLV